MFLLIVVSNLPGALYGPADEEQLLDKALALIAERENVTDDIRDALSIDGLYENPALLYGVYLLMNEEI